MSGKPLKHRSVHKHFFRSGTYLWTSTNFDCRMGKRKNKAKGSDAVEKEKSKSNFAGAPQVLLCLTVVAALIASWFAIGGNRGACTRSCCATGTTGASTGAPERGEQTRTQDTRAQVTGGESRSAEGEQARAHVNGGLEASKLEEKGWLSLPNEYYAFRPGGVKTLPPAEMS